MRFSHEAWRWAQSNYAQDSLVCGAQPISNENIPLLAEWLTSMDEVKMTSKSDPSYARKVEEMKDAKAKLKAANSHLKEHLRTHGCW